MENNSISIIHNQQNLKLTLFGKYLNSNNSFAKKMGVVFSRRHKVYLRGAVKAMKGDSRARESVTQLRNEYSEAMRVVIAWQNKKETGVLWPEETMSVQTDQESGFRSHNSCK